MTPTTPLGLLFDEGTVAALDDAHLLARFRVEHDEVAFAALVSRHGPMVWATARAILGNDHDAADIFQLTFLTLARRAATIRAGASLAAWLHRVAHRLAVANRHAARGRQRVERLAGARRGAAPPPDQAAQVQAELARLPHAYRLAVVLCDLEGLSYAEAAARVGCTEAALRNRLARARGRLRARLEVGSMPAALARAAVARALDPAAALAGRGLLAVWLRVVGTTLLMGGLLAGGFVVGTARHRGGASGAAQRPDPAPPPPAPGSPARSLVIRGRVISPAGLPVAGSAVTLAALTDPADPPVPAVTSGADGGFAIDVPARVVAAVPSFRPAPLIPPRAGMPPPNKALLVATAPGFGVGWADAGDGRASVVIRLVAEGPPITGRVLDRAGQPVAGARVATAMLMEPKLRGPADTLAAAFSALLDQGEKAVLDDQTTESFPVTLATTTDADGRFSLSGAGAERFALGFVTGPTIAQTLFSAATRPAPSLPHPAPDRPLTANLSATNGLDVTVEPTRIITGTVRAAGSGTPLRGWTVTARRHVFLDFFGPTADGQTDALGQFRLVGLPDLPRFDLSITAPAGQPYLDASLTHDTEPGREPVRVDVVVERGVVVRGRVLDRTTGAPILGRITYFRLTESATPGLTQTTTDEEGRYQITLPPGRSLLCFEASDSDRYRLGQWSRRLIPAPDAVGLQPDPLAPYEATHHALAELDLKLSDPAPTVDLPVNSDPAPPPRVEAVDITLSPKPVFELAAVDPNGQPLPGIEVRGTGDIVGDLVLREDGAKILLGGFGASDVRRITARHLARHLAGAITVLGAPTTLQIVRLEPWGEVRGQLVATDGSPLRHAQIKPGPRFGPGSTVEPIDVLPGTGAAGGITTDAEGRFHVVGLVAGTHYGASVADGANTLLGDLVADLVVRPGEVKDLGKIIVARPQRE